MTIVLGGTNPAVTFPDGTIQNTAGLPLTGGTVTGGVNLATSSGNVSIGTTTSISKLTVAGGVSLSGGAGTGNAFYPYYNSATSYNAISSDANGGITFVTGVTAPSIRATIDSSGNVGIGGVPDNTYPARLNLITTADCTIRITKAGANASAIKTVTGALTFGIDAAAGDTERMRIDSSGDLLVGNTSVLFTSTGKSFVIDAGAGGIQLDAVTGAGYSARIYNGNPQVTFDNNSAIRDYVFVKNTGNSYATVTAVINNVSDYRLKENIKPLTGALARIEALKPIQYSFKADVKPAMTWGTAEVDGFLAHEFGEVIVGGCNGEKDAVQKDGTILPQGVDMTRAIPLLVAAIQEQQALITDLTTRLSALESK